jgi:ER membrane protein complex subunit 3
VVTIVSYFVIRGDEDTDQSVQAAGSTDPTLSPFATAGSAPQAGPAADYPKLFKTESSNLEFAEGVHHWIGKDVEERVLRKYGKLSPSTN